MPIEYPYLEDSLYITEFFPGQGGGRNLMKARAMAHGTEPLRVMAAHALPHLQTCNPVSHHPCS